MDSNGRQIFATKNGLKRTLNTGPVAVDVGGPLGLQGKQQVDLKLLKEQLQKTTEALAAARAENHALSEYCLVAQEEERRRIARELHDDLSQHTAIVEFKLATIEPFVKGPQGIEALSAARAALAKLERGLRDISHQLHPSIVTDLGLPAALKQLVNEFNESGGSATLDDRNAVPIFDALVETALYRIAQEALRNVWKHAGAVPVHLKLSSRVNELYLSIKDSGPGFVLDAGCGDRGLGLLSMRERSRLISGTLMVRSRPGEGTLIVVRVFRGEAAKTNQRKMQR